MQTLWRWVIPGQSRVLSTRACFSESGTPSDGHRYAARSSARCIEIGSHSCDNPRRFMSSSRQRSAGEQNAHVDYSQDMRLLDHMIDEKVPYEDELLRICIPGLRGAQNDTFPDTSENQPKTSDSPGRSNSSLPLRTPWELRCKR